MVRLFRRLLNLYPGEGKKALLFAALAFLSSLAISGCVTIADGMLLEHVGADGLPLVYSLTAGGMLLYTALALLGIRKGNVRAAFVAILAAAGLSYVGVALYGSSAWTLVCAGSDMVFLIGLTGLWNFIDQSYDLQDAKRHYGFFTGSFIIGSGAGASLVSVTINSLGVAGVYALFAGAFFAAGTLAFFIIRRTEPLPEAPADEEEMPQPKGTLRQILTSPFTLYLLLFSVMMGLAQFLMEYTYMDALEGVFAGSHSNELTRFLGTSRGWIYVADMVFGALIYGRMIKRIGVNNASLIPAGYFFLVFLTCPPIVGLAMAILGLIAVEGVLSAIYDSNLQLLLSAVPPKIKTRMRICCENLLEPMGMLLCSGLLFFFESYARVIGVALTAAAIGVALLMRTSYRRALFRRLRDNANHLAQPTPDVNYCDAERLWQALLEDGPADELVLHGRTILRSQGKARTEALRPLLTSTSIERTRVGISVLGLLGSPHHFDTLIPFLDDPSLEVQRTAMHALSHLAHVSSRHHARHLINRLSESDDPLFRRHALKALKPLCDARHVRELLLACANSRTEWPQVETLITQIGGATPLLSLLTSGPAHLDARVLACRVLAKLDIRPANLYTLITAEIDAAYSYFFHMNILKEDKALSERLQSRFWSSLDLIVHLQGLAGLIEDCDLLLRALKSSNEKLHSHAVESLEKGCDARIFRRLVVLVDDRPLVEKLRSCQDKTLPLTHFAASLDG